MLVLRMLALALGTIVLVVALPKIVARVLRLSSMKAHLAAIGVRWFVVALLALVLVIRGGEHRIALLFTVAAAYFAAVLFDGVVQFRKRETRECQAR